MTDGQTDDLPDALRGIEGCHCQGPAWFSSCVNRTEKVGQVGTHAHTQRYARQVAHVD